MKEKFNGHFAEYIFRFTSSKTEDRGCATVCQVSPENRVVCPKEVAVDSNCFWMASNLILFQSQASTMSGATKALCRIPKENCGGLLLLEYT